MTKLLCKIVDKQFDGLSSHNLTYKVYDGKKVVATGVSSSLVWVINDAGGYHTKTKFNELYPDGWEVHFDFSSRVMRSSLGEQ